MYVCREGRGWAAPGPLLGPSWAALGPPLGRSWAAPGLSWGLSGAFPWAFWGPGPLLGARPRLLPLAPARAVAVKGKFSGEAGSRDHIPATRMYIFMVSFDYNFILWRRIIRVLSFSLVRISYTYLYLYTYTYTYV